MIGPSVKGKALSKTKKVLPEQPNETIGQKAIRWHHALCRITGGLSIRIVKQALSREELVEWAATTEQVAKEMKAAIKSSKGKRK